MKKNHSIAVTIIAIVLFMGLVIAGFAHKVTQPRVLPAGELKMNGAYIFPEAKPIETIDLKTSLGEPFSKKQLKGKWTFVFFGYTYCPDICPTTLLKLKQLKELLVKTEFSEDTQFVFVTVDPARDTPEQLGKYLNYFDSSFVGLTGEFMKIHNFASQLNMAFQKSSSGKENYLIDHSGYLALIDPDASYYAFFKPTKRSGKIMVFDENAVSLAYKSIRVSER